MFRTGAAFLVAQLYTHTHLTQTVHTSTLALRQRWQAHCLFVYQASFRMHSLCVLFHLHRFGMQCHGACYQQGTRAFDTDMLTCDA
jgi:hypothetical protein